MNLLAKYEAIQMEQLKGVKVIPSFAPGDQIIVSVEIAEGTTKRIQAFEGLCIARKNRGLASTFTVKKTSHGEAVERIFPLYSPRVAKIEVVRRGKVRRAKLYYIRALKGKAARIEAKVVMHEKSVA